MKKIIAVAILFVNFYAFSQIKVMEVKRLEKLGKVGSNGENDLYVQKSGDEYTFFYKNIENKELTSFRSFSFRDIDKDYENLYTVITNGFFATPLQDIKLELPYDYVWLHFTKNIQQKVSVQFMTSNKVSFSTGVSDLLSMEQIDKLFNR
ncbi:hypothetical protein [Flavobacterium sp.]|uniref:hypothetical protein n=1 Tax=Flavobacterium sp. TaxID=239 RepID=UPI00286E0DEE|nr:hypothetical protein [Flavobacterium sp.]